MIERIDSALAVLRAAADLPPAAFSSSFGAEDMVLLDLIRRHALPIGIFTLDTGRLPEETYALMQEVEERYGRCVATSFPDAQAVQRLVAANGINGFYESRRQPQGVLRGAQARAARTRAGGQTRLGHRPAPRSSRSRAPSSPNARLDPEHGLEKFNPLADWTESDVWAYIRANDVPYNALHDRGYPSIGCAPCTRAIAPGEDVRAGRWWWENPESKECGLHVKDGKLVRAKSSLKDIAVKEIA